MTLSTHRSPSSSFTALVEMTESHRAILQFPPVFLSRNCPLCSIIIDCDPIRFLNRTNNPELNEYGKRKMSSNIYAESAKPISEGNVTNATANPAPSPNAQPPPPAYGVNNAQSTPPINANQVVMQVMQPRPQFGAQQVCLCLVW